MRHLTRFPFLPILLLHLSPTVHGQNTYPSPNDHCNYAPNYGLTLTCNYNATFDDQSVGQGVATAGAAWTGFVTGSAVGPEPEHDLDFLAHVQAVTQPIYIVADSGSGTLGPGTPPDGGNEDYFYALQIQSFHFACGSPATSELPGFPQPCTLTITNPCFDGNNRTLTFAYNPAPTDASDLTTIKQSMDYVDYAAASARLPRTDACPFDFGYVFDVSALGPTALFLDNVLYQGVKYG